MSGTALLSQGPVAVYLSEFPERTIVIPHLERPAALATPADEVLRS
jgi:hypothetical protein